MLEVFYHTVTVSKPDPEAPAVVTAVGHARSITSKRDFQASASVGNPADVAAALATVMAAIDDAVNP